MATFTLVNPRILVNAVDLSDHADAVEVSLSRSADDTTAVGREGRTSAQGVPTDSFTVTFQQDHAAAKVDATLWPLYDASTEFAVAVKATSSAISATNPEWQGTCRLFDYTPLAGSPGELVRTQIKFEVQGKITRDVTP